MRQRKKKFIGSFIKVNPFFPLSLQMKLVILKFHWLILTSSTLQPNNLHNKQIRNQNLHILWLNIRTVCVLVQCLHSVGDISIADGSNVTYGLFWDHIELPTKISMKAEPQLPMNKQTCMY